MGAPVLVKIPRGAVRTVDIVEKELSEGVLPISVLRRMPDGEELLFDITGELIGRR